MVSRLFRKLISPLTRLTPVKNAIQKKAIKKIDAIEKGELKITPPKYSTEKRKAPQVNEKIKMELEKKDESLISKIEEINITSKDPRILPKSERNLPKRPEEYMLQNDKFEEYEYGFYETSQENIEKDRLLFREAIDIIRARMGDAVDTNHHDIPLFDHTTSSYVATHPAVKRVNREKLERVWQYFRPFAERKDQTMVSKGDMKCIEDYVEGTDFFSNDPIKRWGQYMKHGPLKAVALEYNDPDPQIDRPTPKVDESNEWEMLIKERQEKEVRRLQKRLEELEELEKEEHKRKK